MDNLCHVCHKFALITEIFSQSLIVVTEHIIVIQPSAIAQLTDDVPSSQAQVHQVDASVGHPQPALKTSTWLSGE